MVHEVAPWIDPELVQAEKELAAFAGAVQELFGDVQVRQSIEDWMTELESTDWASGAQTPDWRCVTIAAARRLAGRAKESSRFKTVSQFTTLVLMRA